MQPLPTPLPPAPGAPMGAAEEAAHVVRAQAGDREAFDELATAAMPMLLGTAMRLLGDRLAAEEVVAEALFRAYRKLDSFHRRSRFSTWTHRILCRAVADRVRERIRERERREKLAARAAHGPRTPPAVHHLEADEKQARLRAAVETLPPTQRLVILLVVWEGLSLKDTAEVTGQRYRTVKSNLHHARRALERALEEGAAS